MTDPAQAQPWPPWMTALERAQQRVTSAASLLVREPEPPVDLTAAAAAIEAGLAAIYDAVDLRVDRLAACQQAATALSTAQQALASAGDWPTLKAAATALGAAQSHLAVAQQDLGARPAEPPPTEQPPLLASGDLPRLHELRRPSLRPRLRPAAPPAELVVADDPPPRPQSFEELHATIEELKRRAEAQRAALQALKPQPKPTPEPEPPPPGFDPDAAPAIDEAAFVRARTRELLEEVAMIGLQRAPLLGDPWRTARVLEHRMLRAIDGIVSMGAPALSFVEELALDGPIRDPNRVFSTAMVMGCVRGRDALAVAERVFFDVELVEPDCRHALAAALKLVPHDLLPLILRTLIADTDPRHSALAIEVLGYRGLATEAELVSAALGEPLVAAQALPHLALTRSPSFTDIAAGALAKPDDELRRATWLAMALGAERGTQHALREGLTTELVDDAALLLALCGDEHDATTLVDHARAEPTPGLATALGWTGSVIAIAPLMSWLEQNDEPLAIAAAYGLDRITGANMIDEVALDIEDFDVPEPPEPDLGEPKPVKLTHLVSDPRDLPPEPATEAIERPTTNPERWHQWWREHGGDFSSNRRYRCGRPYSPEVSLWELDQARRVPAERRLLQRELCIRTASFVRTDPHDLVADQERALQEWAPQAARTSSMAGTWHRPLPR